MPPYGIIIAHLDGLSDELKLSIAQARAIIIQGIGDKRLRLLRGRGNKY